METVWKCPLCESDFDKHRFFARSAVRFEPNLMQITYAQCEKCGLVFLWDRFSDEENESYYMKGKYRTVVQGTPQITPRVITEQASRAEFLLPYIDEEPTSVLDIGASTGIWLDVLRTKFDCEVLGIEPGEHFRINNPFDVKMYSEMNLLYTPDYYNRFDMITVIHVLEHMNDPLGFLVSLHEFITEDGSLFIEVPNLMYENCLTISHPVCFTPDTLKYTLQLAGWEVEWMELYNSFKTERTNPPNILVKARPGRIDDIIPEFDADGFMAEYESAQAILAKDFDAWTKKRK